MTVFSARFIVLACLCAALPLAPPVEAAHLHVSRPMEKHATSPRPPHATRTPSSFDSSTPAHKHKDEHNDHREHGHEHRPTRSPPLLRHYREHDHNFVQSQDAHDRADDKIPRSAFARSRYRRERTSHSSVYVPGEHGNTFIVSGTPSGHGEHGHASTDKRTSHAHQRRQVDGNNLVSGRIDIMSAAQSPSSTQRLASLTVDSTPIDWTSGQSSAKAFSLNASTTNQTQFMMVPTDDSDAAGKHVRLATQVFDAGSADMVMYCATYNANPGTPSALLMTPCTDAAQSAFSNNAAINGPCAGDQDDASSSKSQQSQIFSYDPFSGVIEPISSTEDSSSSDRNSDISASCAGAKIRRDTSNSMTSGSATPSSTSTKTVPTPNVSQHAQNVTLVYVAGALEVPAPSPSAGVNSSTASTTATPSAHMNQAAVVTTTVTTTVVTTVMASGTVSPAMADASVPTSSTPTSTSGSSLSASSTTTSRTVMTTSANAEESLEVEVVGVAPSTTTGSSSTSDLAPTITTSPSTSTMSTSSSSPHSTASPSLNAEAVASLVVEQMHHRSVLAIASASVV